VFWILIALNILGLIPSYYQWKLLNQLSTDGFTDFQFEDEIYVIELFFIYAQLGFYVISIFVFIQWFRRAYGNLHRLGIGPLSYSESMPLWSWFIPLANVFVPALIMNEIWIRTREGIKDLIGTYVEPSGKYLLGLWWFLYVMSALFNYHFLKNVADETTEELMRGFELYFISDLEQVIEAILVIMIVRPVSKMESRLAQEIANAGGEILYK